jgi:hypothetical protein
MRRLPKFVNGYIDRHGKPRFYFRRAGFKKVPLAGLPWSPEFMAAYQHALDLSPRVEIGADRTKPGTIDALIVHYLKSDAFTKALAPETQRMRRNILDRFRTDHGAKGYHRRSESRHNKDDDLAAAWRSGHAPSLK